MAKVLVVGGAGYVGSTTCAWLLDRGHQVWVLDDLSTGYFELIHNSNFTLGQAGDTRLVTKLLQESGPFDCVMYFAARSLVSESFLKPEEYHSNNVVQTSQFLKTLLENGGNNFIFSSTCAIFGNPGSSVITEDLEKKPLNPYGQTKLEVEENLKTLSLSHGLKAIALRYFNAAGAEPSLRVGEWHEPETHLIPRILWAANSDLPVEIFGTDYPTPDGTCVRDYVHVWDLAAAHGAAMERLLSKGKSTPGFFEAYNLGSGTGYSVRQVVEEAEKVIGKKIRISEKSRRQGDPPFLVADSRLAQSVLGFKQSKDNLSNILTSAWQWEQKKIRSVRKAVFLDRDGTLNEDPGYLSDPDQVKLLPQVGEGLALLKRAGYLLVVVSNQSGVGRGLIAKEAMPLIHARLDSLLGPWGAKINHYELCFHHPDDGCDCRKPKPRLIKDAARTFAIDLSSSYVIGDKVSDLLAGQAAGCKGSILVKTGNGLESTSLLQPGQATFIGDSLLEAARWILSQ